MLVLVKLVLPTTLASPTGAGYWLGFRLPYMAAQHETAVRTVRAVEEAEPSNEMMKMMPVGESRPFAGTADVAPVGGLEAAAPVHPPAAETLTWQAIVLIIYAGVTFAMLLLLVQRILFVRGLIRQSKDAGSDLAGVLEECRQQLGISRRTGLKLSANASSPAVCGLLRPVILIPEDLSAKLTPERLRAVLLHELAHIKRGDLWMNMVQTLLQIVYFYNPFLWLANFMLARAREQAVDEMVLVAMGGEAERYPDTLVSVARLSLTRPSLSLRLIGVVESRRALSGRIRHILNRPMPKSAELGILGLAGIIVFAAVLLPMAKAEKGKATTEAAQEGVRGSGNQERKLRRDLRPLFRTA